MTRLRSYPLLAVLAALLFALTALPAHAHVGSPDVYVEGSAGPYKLSVVVRPPLVKISRAEIGRIRAALVEAELLSLKAARDAA